MTHVLNPEFRYVANRGTRMTYIVSRWGGQSVVNTDAIELLADVDSSWQADPEYGEFIEQAKRAKWLVPETQSASAKVRWVEHPVHLKRVQYEINLLCNLKCVHCYCSASPQAPAGMPTEFVLDLVRQASALGVINFDITGGEPLVRNDVAQIVRAISASGMIPGLLSNCTLVTRKLALELMEAGLASVQASLDSCTPEVHDEIRGKRGAFERALQGIQLFREVGVPLRISVTLNRKNAHQAADMVRFFRDEMKVPFNFDRVIPAGRSTEQRNPLELSNAEFYEIVRAVGGVSTSKICDSPNLFVGGGQVEPGCGVGASFMFIKQDGRAALCPTMTEAESPAFAQADLRTMSLADAWQSHPTFQRFRNMQCENASFCPSGSTCRGGCRSNAYLLHGEVDSPDEMNCNLNKNGAAEYRPFLAEYESLRQQGIFPARVASSARRAARRLPVVT
jgi:radical SAM protein with 4Fe4S-binding SPASM domain